MALSAPCMALRGCARAPRTSLLRQGPAVGRAIPLTRTRATPSGPGNISGKDIDALLKTSTKTDILQAAQDFEGEAAYREREGAGRALDATRQAVYPADNQPHGGQTPLPPKPRPMEWKEEKKEEKKIQTPAAALPKAGASLGAVKFILAAAAGAAVIQAITSTGVLTSSVRGFMHLVSYAIWLGSKAWVTLISNPTLEDSLSDSEHANVQGKLQVKQFALEAAALAVLLGTTLATGGAPNGQLYGLGALAISALLNMCFASPNKSGSDTVTGLLNWVGLGGGLFHGWWLVNAINSAVL